MNLNQDWFFSKEHIDPCAPHWNSMEKVTLPHSWNALDGQDGDSYYHRGTCWYACKLPSIGGEEIWLECGAVSQTAAIYLNGKEIGRHEAGFSAFRVELTSYLTEPENILVLSADNSGNQHTYPQFADFTFYGGIYRDVSIITVSRQHFDLDWHGAPAIKVTPTVNADGSAVVAVRAYAKSAVGARCFITITDADTVEVAACEADDMQATFTLAAPHLWQGIKDPYLYCASAVLLDADDSILDEVSARFGIRSFYIDPQKGFFLNGISTPLRGVARHQCRENKGWAISREDERQDIQLISEMGANTVRLAHYQHSQSFYDLCDEYGMIVWAEIPFISIFLDNPTARANTLLQMRELILQSYNHPSICFWGISNEATMRGDSDPALLENQRALNTLCHELDPSRLTVLANLSMVDMHSPQNSITDLVGYNHYFGWYAGDAEQNGIWFDQFHSNRPDVAVALSEYGAEGNINLHSAEPKVRDYTEEYQCIYHEKLLACIESRPWIWGTYVWNMFEFGSDMRNEGMVAGKNNKGLVNFSRTIKKDAYYLYKAHWTDDPFVYLCGRRFSDRCGAVTDVKVYAAGVSEVALHVNGVEIARMGGERCWIFRDVPLKDGANAIRVTGYAADAALCKDEMTINRVEAPNPAYSLPEEIDTAGAESIANWFDPDYINVPLTFAPGYYSVKDRLSDIEGNPEIEKLKIGLLGNMLQSVTSGNDESGLRVSAGMLKMLDHMTFEELCKMAGSKLPGGTLDMVNARLQQIRKPTKEM